MQKYITIGIAVLAVAGGSFFGGMKYAESKGAAAGAQAFRNLSPEERQQRLQSMGANAGNLGNRRGGQTGASFVAGEIIGKDDKSITVQLRTARAPGQPADGQGGSRIIFFSDTTEIMKSATGSTQDLAAGIQITASGTENQDGSITAQTIQVRPNLPAQP